MPSHNTYRLTWVSLTLDVGSLFMAAPAPRSQEKILRRGGKNTQKNIPGSYAILLFTASDLASITSHIHNWVLFLLWLHPFILSEVISPLISSSVLGTYRRGEFLFQYPIILPFHTVHGVLKARILKWFAIPFSSGPHSVRSLHHDPFILRGPAQYGLVSLS